MTIHSRRTILVVQLWGVIFSIILFAIHTAALLSMAFGLRALEKVGHMNHVEVAGPLIILACFIALFITHILEGALWAGFLCWKGLFEDFGEAVYFSLTSFSAVGYGDIVLHKPWRVLGSIMAVNGLLLFGCSTAFLFLVMQKIWTAMA